MSYNIVGLKQLMFVCFKTKYVCRSMMNGFVGCLVTYRSHERWVSPPLFSQTIQSLYHWHKKEEKSAHRRRRERNTVAQDRKDKTGGGEREGERVQENTGAVYQLREAKETGENQLGDASVPPRRRRGRERRRARGVKGFLPNTT